LIDKILEQALGHRAAADIAGANEQDSMRHIPAGETAVLPGNRQRRKGYRL